MRVALVAESFLPHMNGVTHSLLRVLEKLEERGDETLVIAPTAKDGGAPSKIGTTPIVRVPASSLPGYSDVRVSLTSRRSLGSILSDFEPDVVHLASPFVLGWTALRAAAALRVPTVAVYQTEIPSYAERYKMVGMKSLLWNHIRKIHQRATLTLAPSTHALDQLALLGVDRLRYWPRGVDAARFHPSRRSEGFRARVAPHGETIVGYVGRLAPEKRVEDLAQLAGIPGISVVIVGDGPSRATLDALLPQAHFEGILLGDQLAAAVASFDIFVHCGELETFGQAIQEALAAGVPVVAPRRGGPVDLVRDSETGFLYPPGDLVAMAQSVRWLVDHPDHRVAYGARARISVEGRTWSKVCDALVGHYEDAIAGAAAPSSATARVLAGVA